jgi:hypothetical protein
MSSYALTNSYFSRWFKPPTRDCTKIGEKSSSMVSPMGPPWILFELDEKKSFFFQDCYGKLAIYRCFFPWKIWKKLHLSMGFSMATSNNQRVYIPRGRWVLRVFGIAVFDQPTPWQRIRGCRVWPPGHGKSMENPMDKWSFFHIFHGKKHL